MILSNIVAVALVNETFAVSSDVFSFGLFSESLASDTTEIAPVKLFAALVSVISFVPAVKLVVPVILSAPLPSTS